jgi:hypothetical protein
VLDRAEQMQSEEQNMLAALRSGRPATQVLGRRYEEMLEPPTAAVQKAQ